MRQTEGATYQSTINKFLQKIQWNYKKKNSIKNLTRVILFSTFPLSKELQMLLRNHLQLLTKSNPDFTQFLSSLNPSLNNDKKTH
jgi:hypothetical protein